MQQNLTWEMEQVLIYHNLLKKFAKKLEINKLGFNKLSELDTDKLEPVTSNLSKLNDVVKTAVVKKNDYNAKVK